MKSTSHRATLLPKGAQVWKPRPDGVKPLSGPRSDTLGNLEGWPWRPGPGEPLQKQALGMRTWEQTTSFFLETRPGVNERQMEVGLTKMAGVSNPLLIPQLPSFPISAPDLRLEAEVPKPLSPL